MLGRFRIQVPRHSLPSLATTRTNINMRGVYPKHTHILLNAQLITSEGCYSYEEQANGCVQQDFHGRHVWLRIVMSDVYNFNSTLT